MLSRARRQRGEQGETGLVGSEDGTAKTTGITVTARLQLGLRGIDKHWLGSHWIELEFETKEHQKAHRHLDQQTSKHGDEQAGGQDGEY